MVEIVPITEINKKRMIGVAQSIPTKFVVVRLLDIISHITLEPKSVFYKIRNVGGIHNYLNYNGIIILSLIVKDDMLSKLTPPDYAFIINTLKPNFYTTPDCETYEGEQTISIEEIKKSLFQTKEIIERCPFSFPIGHVKGCDEWMIEKHVKMLKMFGIKDFIFHTGDFFRSGDQNMINKAKNLAFKIRPHARYLLLYGMGSQNNLLEFSFADAYITNTHLVTALNGKKFVGTKKVRYSEKYDINIVKENLIEIFNNVQKIKEQKKLFEGGACLWEEVQEEPVKVIVRQLKLQ